MQAGCLDHHPMPLVLLLDVVFSMYQWLHDETEECERERAVAVHCMAGKGRTGMVIAAYLALSDPGPAPASGSDPSLNASRMALEKLDLFEEKRGVGVSSPCLLYTSPSPRDQRGSRMPSSA